MRASIYAAPSFDPNGIVAGGYDFKADKETLLTGLNFSAGTLLGKITGTGKYTVSESTATDGSELPVAVLLEDIDATASDQAAMIMKAGGVVGDRMTFGTGHTVASVKDNLIARGIFIL